MAIPQISATLFTVKLLSCLFVRALPIHLWSPTNVAASQVYTAHGRPHRCCNRNGSLSRAGCPCHNESKCAYRSNELPHFVHEPVILIALRPLNFNFTYWTPPLVVASPGIRLEHQPWEPSRITISDWRLQRAVSSLTRLHCTVPLRPGSVLDARYLRMLAGSRLRHHDCVWGVSDTLLCRPQPRATPSARSQLIAETANKVRLYEPATVSPRHRTTALSEHHNNSPPRRGRKSTFTKSLITLVAS